MRILHLIDSLRTGGAEIIAFSLAEALHDKGHDNVLCGLGEQGNMVEMLEKHGIRHYSLGAPYGFRLSVMWRLMRLMASERIDIVIAHHFRQSAHALLPSILLRKPLIHVEHDFLLYQSDPNNIRRFSFLSRFLRAVVTVSPEIRQAFLEHLPRLEDKVRVISNGIDTARFVRDESLRGRIRDEYGIPVQATVIGTCARLEEVKNIELLVEGFASFQQGAGPSRLMIIGDGSRRGSLEALAAGLGIWDQVIFTGFSSDPWKFLCAMDIYAITSRSEGLPMSVLEAMSCELPVVATNVGALGTVVTPKSGILLERSDVGSLVEAIAALSTSDSRRQTLGKNARSFIERNYSREKMVGQYLETVMLAMGKADPGIPSA